jgi:hypothetical protein
MAKGMGWETVKKVSMVPRRSENNFEIVGQASQSVTYVT